MAVAAVRRGGIHSAPARPGQPGSRGSNDPLDTPVFRVADHREAPANALGFLRVMFTVDDLEDTLARLRRRGAELVAQVVQYEDAYRLCYIRGPEGILIGLAQELELAF